jgi:hypothetical protein
LKSAEANVGDQDAITGLRKSLQKILFVVLGKLPYNSDRDHSKTCWIILHDE